MQVDFTVNIVSIIEVVMLVAGGIYALGKISGKFGNAIELVEGLAERVKEIETSLKDVIDLHGRVADIEEHIGEKVIPYRYQRRRRTRPNDKH